MAENILELSLKSLRLLPSLAGPDRGERMLIATLIWPRPRIAERIASQPVKLARGWLDLSGADWSERILFKENVEGRFGLVLRVTEPLSEAQMTRFLAQWGAGLLRLAGTETAKLAAGPWGASFTRIPLNALAGEMSHAARAPSIEACGRMTLQPGKTETRSVPLTSPRDRFRAETRRIAGRRSARRVRVATWNEPVGEVVLDLKYYK